jgi:hypothetical protein
MGLINQVDIDMITLTGKGNRCRNLKVKIVNSSTTGLISFVNNQTTLFLHNRHQSLGIRQHKRRKPVLAPAHEPTGSDKLLNPRRTCQKPDDSATESLSRDGSAPEGQHVGDR